MVYDLDRLVHEIDRLVYEIDHEAVFGQYLRKLELISGSRFVARAPPMRARAACSRRHDQALVVSLAEAVHRS